jgi:hypothetical protein
MKVWIKVPQGKEKGAERAARKIRALLLDAESEEDREK